MSTEFWHITIADIFIIILTLIAIAFIVYRIYKEFIEQFVPSSSMGNSIMLYFGYITARNITYPVPIIQTKLLFNNPSHHGGIIDNIALEVIYEKDVNKLMYYYKVIRQLKEHKIFQKKQEPFIFGEVDYVRHDENIKEPFTRIAISPQSSTEYVFAFWPISEKEIDLPEPPHTMHINLYVLYNNVWKKCDTQSFSNEIFYQDRRKNWAILESQHSKHSYNSFARSSQLLTKSRVSRA